MFTAPSKSFLSVGKQAGEGMDVEAFFLFFVVENWTLSFFYGALPLMKSVRKSFSFLLFSL